MRGGVPSHLGHWRSIGYCIGEKCSKIYWQKIAFFLLQTHLLAVALRLSKFLPVILTLAPSLDGNSESLIENWNIENKYVCAFGSWHSASATLGSYPSRYWRLAVCDDYLSRHPDIRERQSAVLMYLCHASLPPYLQQCQCTKWICKIMSWIWGFVISTTYMYGKKYKKSLSANTVFVTKV